MSYYVPKGWLAHCAIGNNGEGKGEGREGRIIIELKKIACVRRKSHNKIINDLEAS